MTPRPCIIFTQDILKSIGKEEPTVTIDRIVNRKEELQSWIRLGVNGMRHRELAEREYPDLNMRKLLNDGELYEPKDGYVGVP